MKRTLIAIAAAAVALFAGVRSVVVSTNNFRRDANGTVRFERLPPLPPLPRLMPWAEAHAARNGSGTYSLYTPGNPVTTSTTITSSWANNSLNDIATALTDSLSRSGSGGMLASLRGVNGTVGSPAFSWTSETNSGWYRNAAGDIRLAVLGADILTTSSAGLGLGGAAIDRLTAAALTIGTTNATTISIGRSGQSLAIASDIAVNTNKFTVAASSGNVVAAGTLGVTGDITGQANVNATGSFVGASGSSLFQGAGLQLTGSTHSGQKTLAAGAGTVTIASGKSGCVCTDNTANASVKCTVSGTTLTIAGTGTDQIYYLCF